MDEERPEHRSARCEDARGRRQGASLEWHPNGVLWRRTSYRDGREDGWSEVWDAEGAILSARELRKGAWIARRRLSEEEPPRASREGDPVHPCPAGGVVAGLAPPAGREQWCEQRRADGAYVREGTWLEWFSPGRGGGVSTRGSYRDGRKHGVFRENSESGLPKEERHWAEGRWLPRATSWSDAGVKISELVPEASGQRATHWRKDGSLRDEVLENADGELVRRTFWYSNGRKQAEERWSGGHRNGLQRRWWPNGELWEEGAERDGQAVGTWQQWSPSGVLMQVEHTEPGEGSERQTFAVWSDGAPLGALVRVAVGPQRSLSPPLACREGARPFADSQSQGLLLEACGIGPGPLEVLFDDEGPQLALRGGELHGPTLLWDGRGERLAEGLYAHGRRHGRQVEWFESGATKRVESFSRGVRHGPFATWHGNGARRTLGGYRRGERHGIFLECQETGLCQKREEFRHGALHGLQVTLWEDGTRRVEQEFRRGKPHGRYASWKFEGEQTAEGHYAVGEKHGRFVEWHGPHVESEGRYRRGRRVGTWSFYHEDGSLRARGGYAWCEKPPAVSTVDFKGGRRRLQEAAGEGCRKGPWTFWLDGPEKPAEVSLDETTPTARAAGWDPRVRMGIAVQQAPPDP